jgi:hypothetical protein
VGRAGIDLIDVSFGLGWEFRGQSLFLVHVCLLVRRLRIRVPVWTLVIVRGLVFTFHGGSFGDVCGDSKSSD